ncbi:unnamed protein product [Rotaria magnacalcarata]|uniref:Dynein light chain Tctex-type 1 n=1 Tax=Rotaria magnacalcarata TaxID=392030 RepID=A0A819SCC8_9BILA|nr:unnamed protein product [Rotaria magnacalcarata]CAF1656401.1 unnamed protein product [Rotaria magnacalcarata]CAF2095641.1 unnamed protein product [Rotaria magnacalcarata]CAF2135661.1 unnamed protein product [Rotaria magnacalcarata]CAF2182906.1 unnamed protein product [Rotaria magnacalcarata]
MDDIYQKHFVVHDASNIINETIESTLRHQSYQKTKVNLWTSNIVETIISALTKANQSFKYIASCVIMEKNGAGLHTATSCFWDNVTDKSFTIRWENTTMYVIVTVYGLSI